MRPHQIHIVAWLVVAQATLQAPTALDATDAQSQHDSTTWTAVAARCVLPLRYIQKSGPSSNNRKVVQTATTLMHTQQS